MELSIEDTLDGWRTLYLPEQNEHYHSTFGAAAESQWIYIERGLLPLLEASPKPESAAPSAPQAASATVAAGAKPESAAPLRLLEMGFGTGLNAILSLRAAESARKSVCYTGIEAYPLSPQTIQDLGYAARLGQEGALYEKLHDLPWQPWPPREASASAAASTHAAPVAHEAALPFTTLTSYFQARKIKALFQETDFEPHSFDLIYYDAFSPRVQPELWTEFMARRLKAALSPGGRLITYCAQGRWKKHLTSVGFTLTSLPGPGPKREITLAEIL